MADSQENDKNIEIWKIKKLIKALESARGNGTSMISLIIPPGDQIARVTKMLAEEYGTASNIKSRVNLTDDGKERKVTFDFVPFKPINASLYLCDNKFHTEPLTQLLESDEKFGFIVMDGMGLFWDLSGNTREARGIDVSYGGENGFNQAIELSAEILSNVKFIQEKRLIGKFFEEISQDTGKYVFGVDDTIKALEMGAVETLIVWENLDINRHTLKNSVTNEIVIKFLNKDQENDQSNFKDTATSAELEVQEKMPLLEWFANEYRNFGCSLEFVTNRSQEGSQFCRGFGGIGGILRYQLDMRSFDEPSDEGEFFEDSD
ncbi:UNVERIFIED_CONTAM: Eukaryotic peptide chain release factor subunit-3 [Sesamum calycinum]|uniref:Eukaryotic peptide chain release factor subunit-3 n=1 Tax=Sesamum calycinum TaxID=2727403 RepID=A0AAW2LSH3_9LAMI